MSQTNFSALKLIPGLRDNLSSLGYTSMTPIQAQSLPPILSGKDIIGQGKTGSGKTAAFALGVLNKLDVRAYRVQALLLCPTRELAEQVANETRRLARAIHNIKVVTLCGGVPFGPQVGSLSHGAHIVVGTPGRIEDHLRKGTLKLTAVNMVVLDEADRMLDMGFQQAIDDIFAYVPDERQTLLFSATYPDTIQSIAARIMRRPTIIQVAEGHDHTTIREYFYRVAGNRERSEALRVLLMHFKPAAALVFCNTKRASQEVADALSAQGFSALALHGDLEQRDREQTLVRFSNKSVRILVATDVAARGLDIDALDVVINYDVAHSREVHVHRIGRTGRAGETGTALSLYDEAEAHRVAVLGTNVDPIRETQALPKLDPQDQPEMKPAMATLQIDGGKKQKLRPGDVLGALTGDGGITGAQVGKINVLEGCIYVAVARDAAKPALQKLSVGKLKGRSCRARLI